MQRPRLIIGRLILLLIAALAVDQSVFLGLLRPLRVESGSMAETVKGPHYRVKCGECGYEFACDATKPPRSGYATCPLCGNKDNKLDDTIYPGDRLFIDRTAFWWRDPRRWEPIVFRDPDGGHLTIKRVVGLPGETISIRDGEVYADGQLLEKPDDVRRAMGILVSDSEYIPKKMKSSGEPEPPSSVFLGRAWEQGKERVLDNYGYNQAESRRLNEVRHVWGVVDGKPVELESQGGRESCLPPVGNDESSHSPAKTTPDPISSPRVQIFRDVYYTDVPRPGTGVPLEKYELGPDEYFVLGDNSPISDDSRYWPHPGLPVGLIVGKPIGVR